MANAIFVIMVVCLLALMWFMIGNLLNGREKPDTNTIWMKPLESKEFWGPIEGPKSQPEPPEPPKPYPNDMLEARHIIEGYLSGMDPPFDGWHHIDNADNDLLREIIKQLIRRMYEDRR